MIEKLAVKVAGIAGGAIGISEAADPSLGAFLFRRQDATSRFVNGDPTRLNQIASRREDVVRALRGGLVGDEQDR